VNTLPDGAFLEQVMANPDSVDAVPDAERIVQEVIARDANAFERLCDLVERTHDTECLNSFKVKLRGRYTHSLHPLLRVALASGVPVRDRLFAGVFFVQLVLKALLRWRFAQDVAVRGLLSSGFTMAFSRLCFLLFPMSALFFCLVRAT